MPLVCNKCGHHNTWDTASVPQGTIWPDDSDTAAGLRAALANVEAELARFQTYAVDYISALLKAKKDVEFRLQGVVYPILSLPTEIIARIFVECLPEKSRRRFSRKHAPLLLMRVCRRWRDIAVSTSELWTFLHIRCLNVSPSSDKTMVRHGALSTPSLCRAQSRLLSLIVYLDRKFWEGREVHDDISGAEALDISAILPRLERLDIGLSAEKTQLLTSWNTPFPQLRCLSLSSSDSVLSDILRNAPILKELHWTRRTDGNLNFGRFTSNTLTLLEITGRGNDVPATQLIDILENFPSLTDLICLLDLEGFDPPDHDPLTFPNLRTLKTISYGYPSYDPEINVEISVLEPLTLPGLTCLHCTTSPDAHLVTDFMSRSACAIRDLRCEFIERDPEDVWHALALFPFVETLDIDLQVHISPLLQCIDTEDKSGLQSPRLLPRLQHLTLTYSGCAVEEDPINYIRIIDVLRRRREHTTTAELRSLHIMVNETTEWERYPGDTLAAEFHRFIANGLDFTIGVQGNVVWPGA
ncbi:F-box domain-containing protein [Mycena sanguinolenta]|uniref:F-box domain-containing protein n=1 Tax=Mycena sanguinolenta TaxID=230812 RepID=A0A8H7CTC6_9AGAR|nr:F-box domain-containing protein [Mycena sanguinolenta]